jgi:hypothetical protein
MAEQRDALVQERMSALSQAIEQASSGATSQ